MSASASVMPVRISQLSLRQSDITPDYLNPQIRHAGFHSPESGFHLLESGIQFPDGIEQRRLQNDSAGDLIVTFYHRQRGTEATRDLGIIRVSA